MNKITELFMSAMSRMLRHSRYQQPSGRTRKVRHRGYYLGKERVYYRPAAPWVPNIKGTRFEAGKRIPR